MTALAEHRFRASAGEIAWYEWGDPAGRPVLLLHATGFHARCWDAVVELLPRDLRIIAPDFRGHGRSYRPETLADWGATARDIAELVEALGLHRCIAAGHSMGGQCLVRIADASPDRFDRLLLIDPVIFSPERYENAPDPASIDPDDHMVARRRNHWASPQEMVDRFVDRPPYSLWQPRILRDYCEHGLLPDGDGYALACPPRLEASVYLGSMIANPWPAIERCRLPVRILRASPPLPGAEHDFAASPCSPDLAGRFPNGTDDYRPDLTHFMPMQAPALAAERIVAEISFADQ